MNVVLNLQSNEELQWSNKYVGLEKYRSIPWCVDNIEVEIEVPQNCTPGKYSCIV